MRRTAFRRLWIAALPLLAAFFAPGFVRSGLGQWQMDPSYSVYTSHAADGTYVYTTVEVSGFTSGSCPTFPAQLVNECHSATHTPDAYNLLGGVGGWQNGSPSYWPDNISMTNSQQVAATPGSIISWSFGGEVYCTGCGCYIWTCPISTGSVLQYTAIQHNYTVDPLPQPCWISAFFDAVRHDSVHGADDVVYDNGQKTGGVTPAYGTAVYAMEAGKVVAAPSSYGPAPQGYPACTQVTPAPPGNYVKIQAVAASTCAGSSGDNYSTIYFHVLPSVSVGQCVTAGQQIGTLDNSGCQSAAHTHIARKDPKGNPVNFHTVCTNDPPTKTFFDGLVDDWVPSSL
jgi:hypothetical protein